MPVLENGIQCIHQAIPKRIRVHIERGMDKMRNIRPEHAIFRGKLESRPKALPLHVQPDFSQSLGQNFPRPPLVMDARFELVERDLAHHCVQHVLDLGRQHDPSLRRRRRVQQRSERQHFPEYAGGFRQGQRRAGHQTSLLTGQYLVDPVPQFMRQSHHVAGAPVVIQQQIRMHAGNRRMGEGAARFTGGRGRVDPGIVEKPLADRRQFRTERAISGQNARARIVPRNDPIVIPGQRGVAIPMLQLL